MSADLPQVVALLPDLMLGLRVHDVLTQLQFAALLVDTPAQFIAALHADTALGIIDLRHADPALLAAVTAAKQAFPTVPLLGFGSHVATEALRAAHQAGIDRLVINSKFQAELPELIRSLARV